MHTRSSATRERLVHDARFTLLNAHFATLTMTTASGTYIKEFVHGDLGRTEPSLASLLDTDTDILQLDVADIIDEEE